jgi:hypothetical protein
VDEPSPLEGLEGSEALLMEPRADYDSCIVGIGFRFSHGPLAVYDIDRVLAVLEKDGISHEDAVEHFEFNMRGAWSGDGTPIYIHLTKNAGEDA